MEVNGAIFTWVIWVLKVHGDKVWEHAWKFQFIPRIRVELDNLSKWINIDWERLVILELFAS